MTEGWLKVVAEKLNLRKFAILLRLVLATSQSQFQGRSLVKQYNMDIDWLDGAGHLLEEPCYTL